MCTTLRQATRVITNLYDRELSDTGLSITNYSLLVRIDANDGITTTELASELLMERTTLTRNLRPLIAKGFVSATPGEDLRRRPLRITEAGQTALLQAFGHWQRAQRIFQSRYGAKRSAALLSLIDEALVLAEGL